MRALAPLAPRPRDCSPRCTCSRGAPRWPSAAARSAGGARHSSETPRAAPEGTGRGSAGRRRGGGGGSSRQWDNHPAPRAPKPVASPTCMEPLRQNLRSRLVPAGLRTPPPPTALRYVEQPGGSPFAPPPCSWRGSGRMRERLQPGGYTTGWADRQRGGPGPALWAQQAHS